MIYRFFYKTAMVLGVSFIVSGVIFADLPPVTGGNQGVAAATTTPAAEPTPTQQALAQAMLQDANAKQAGTVTTGLPSEAIPPASDPLPAAGDQAGLAAQPAAASTGESAPAPTSQDADADNAFGSTPNSRASFTTMVRNLLPLSPQQIITLRDMFDQTQQAVAQYPGVPPKPTSSSILVNMSPGSTPPVIRLSAGYVTSLVFLDSTGQPWPVVGYDLGNPRAFNIQPAAPDGKSDTLIVQASVSYQEGNLAVMLKGENTPVMLTLIPGQRAVDYRVDLRIPGLGPNAVVGVAGLPQTENPMLVSFLDGVAPQGAKLLDIEGAPAQGWAYQGHLFLRTRVTILSPGWISSMNSPDGTHVYELAKTPVVLASERGQMVQLSIRGL